ncbi:MAG TPA: hypothetical protein PK975_05120 [Candidatus Hydrogenedentes bacterium]|nr:hypothetical protein [Candidatus Hydrogenedentota bacterium]
MNYSTLLALKNQEDVFLQYGWVLLLCWVEALKKGFSMKVIKRKTQMRDTQRYV